MWYGLNMEVEAVAVILISQKMLRTERVLVDFELDKPLTQCHPKPFVMGGNKALVTKVE